MLTKSTTTSHQPLSGGNVLRYKMKDVQDFNIINITPYTSCPMRVVVFQLSKNVGGLKIYSDIHVSQNAYFLEHDLLYSHVADFAFFRTSLVGSKQWAGSVLASLMVNIVERVPFKSKLDLKAVLQTLHQCRLKKSRSSLNTN